ncbi:MAG: hypothetical protein GF333_02070 [Candidatus Omnitrophica bacterium]|nr:hypothetical protein [Candidatus Omnitrophota bacterium]
MIVYVNGSFRDQSACGEVYEPGFLFGWGLFETMRVYGGKLPFLHLHLERLKRGMGLVRLEPVSCEWEHTLQETLRRNEIDEGYVRISVYKRKEGTGVSIYAAPFRYYGPQMYERGVDLFFSPCTRHPGEIASRVKSMSYLQNRLAWLQAQEQGCAEALMAGPCRTLLGGARSNVFIVRHGETVTPAARDGAFEGVTRKVVLDMLSDLKIPFREGKVSAGDVYAADEVFLTSALMEIMPVARCGRLEVGTREKTVIPALRARYREIVYE